MAKGYPTIEYCPDCNEYTDCYRNTIIEDINNIWIPILLGFLTLGAYWFISANRPYKYYYTCEECGKTFYQEDEL